MKKGKQQVPEADGAEVPGLELGSCLGPACTCLHLPAPACTRLHPAPACTHLHPPAPACTRLHPPAPACTRLHPPAMHSDSDLPMGCNVGMARQAVPMERLLLW